MGVKALSKVGGLDGRDQSRSRSRTSIVSRLTFENRRDYPSCRDQLFFISVEIFKIEIFQSRFNFVEIFIEIVEIHRDYRDKSRLSRHFEIYQHFWEIFTNRQLWKVTSFHRCILVKWIKSRSRFMKIIATSRSRSRNYRDFWLNLDKSR